MTTAARPSVPSAGFQGRGATILVPLILASLSMLGPFTIDTPFPAYPELGQDLDADTAQLQLVVSVYLVAFAVMSPFPGPLSDAVGRRPIIVGSVCVYAVASVGCALATSLPMLLALRVLQGLSVAGAVVVSRTVIRDVYEGPEAQRLMSRVMMMFALAPAVAPIVGGLLLQVGAWPVIFWFLGAFGVTLVALVVVALPETHPPERRQPVALAAVLGSLAEVTRSGRFHRVSWAAALSFAGQFLYIGSAPIFVVDLLGLGELDFWVLFVPMIAGVMVGGAISSRAAGRLSGRRLVTGAMVFGVLGAVVNVVLGLLPTSADLPHAVVGPSLIAVGTAAAYPTLQLILLDMFPARRGAAVSMFTFFTLLLNGIAASTLAPAVAGSVLTLAIASLGLVLAGSFFWVWHLAASPSAPAAPTAAAPGPADQVRPGVTD